MAAKRKTKSAVTRRDFFKPVGLKKSFYGRQFYYTGNIVHIQDYIERNKSGRACKVKIFISPVGAEEMQL